MLVQTMRPKEVYKSCSGLMLWTRPGELQIWKYISQSSRNDLQALVNSISVTTRVQYRLVHGSAVLASSLGLYS